MGIPVEKNETAPLKSELKSEPLSSKVQVLPDSMIDKTPPKEPSKNVTNKTSNDSVIFSSPSRLRIQIFIKGKEAEDSKEHSDSDQNKTEETIFNNIPKSRVFLRRIIIHNNGLNKPEIDSSEEVSSGSGESIKDVLGLKPFGIENAPNPLDIFFNLLKLTEAPIDNIFNILEKQKNRQTNTPAIDFSEKSAKNDKVFTPKDEIEDFNSVEKQPNEQKFNKPEKNEKLAPINVKVNETRSEKQEISTMDNEELNPINLVNNAQRMISTIEQKQHYNDNLTPHETRTPVVRFFRFISPNHPHVEQQDTYSPMYQRTVYQHPNPYPHGMTRLPFSQENMANKGSFSGEHDKMNDVRYSTQRTTMTPNTVHQTQTTIPPEVYSTTPSGYSIPSNYRQNFGEIRNQQHKEAQNQITSISNNQQQPGMIDRINTENIKPFEDFFRYRHI